MCLTDSQDTELGKWPAIHKKDEMISISYWVRKKIKRH